MTTNVTKTILVEGSTKLVVSLLIESDGTSGELVNYSILDPTEDFTPNLSSNTQLTVNQVWYDSARFDTVLSFNALNPLPVWVFSKDSGSGYQDFRYFGGLKDRAGTDHDGKVLITTTGMIGVASSVGTMVIEFKKN